MGAKIDRSDVDEVSDWGEVNRGRGSAFSFDGVFEGLAVGSTSFRNGSSSGCHSGLWWLIEDEEDGEVVICIWREFNGRNGLKME
ncbi:hypothetical protein Tco_1132962 [Tanacetum coccineum]|uniref:Uncharacterized protein n=1 Tax=Tanacetum coccineum TaxID=301880 RepID=A0ABQ5JEG3_9ASTR